jgi:hypothetical protein
LQVIGRERRAKCRCRRTEWRVSNSHSSVFKELFPGRGEVGRFVSTPGPRRLHDE